MSTARFYSKGKLLITGEYLVLDGALSLAAPVKLGQSLHVEPAQGQPLIQWESRVKGHPWFKAVLGLPELEIQSATDKGIALRLQTLLQNAASLKPEKLHISHSLRITTDLEFDLMWGLGSSSTLVSNVAYWFEVDPYTLFWMTYEGSAYDIACARSERALLYRLENKVPVVREVDFNPLFGDRIFFAYLGEKQDSASGIHHYRSSRPASVEQLERISAISEQLWQTHEQDEFNQLLIEHESIISQIIGVVPVSQTRFKDFPGAVKSLGAWGGDFIMASGSADQPQVQTYLKAKGLMAVFPFHEMIL